MTAVHRWIEAQVERTPEAIAVIDGARRMTFRELDAAANRVAHRLGADGVGPGDRVGIACPRSAEMIVLVLGTMKAGAAYLPVDPAWPAARREVVLADARPRAVLGGGDVAAAAGLPASRLDVAVGDDDAMVVLATSGSTGRPKGVVIPHRAIDNRLRAGEAAYPFVADEIACARTPLGFVDSVAEIFAPLAAGVPLAIVGDEASRDLALMVRELAGHGATRIVLVPTLLATLLEIHSDLGARLPRMHTWFLGGEPVPLPLVEAFRRAAPGRRLVNLYGATEVSGDATWYDFADLPPRLTSAPIGTPLPGCRALVLDEAMREVAPGEVGEVWIGGACLALGYLDRPELTRDRFVETPQGRLYRTGDRGRVLPSGDLQYLGRADAQVKIRGVRVELGEVEARLAAVAGVAQAVAVAQDGRLIGFYTVAPDAEVSAGELRAHLAAHLPDAMVPSFLVELDELPLSPSGKIDRRALAAGTVHVPAGGEPPAGDDERAIAAIWERVLGVGPIGRGQDFRDLGGTSLAAARIVAAIADQLGRRVPIRAVFEHPTVAGLAAVIAPAAPSRPARATGRPLPAELPLGHHQVPFWFFHALTGDVPVVSEVFGFSAPVDVARLARAYADTVASLDALWMRLPRWRPVQRPAPRRPVGLEVRAGVDLQAEADALNDLRFDLEAPPHVHARLVRLPGGDDRLLVAMPHVAVDLTAMELFRRALEARYAGAAPPAPAASLADLVAWEREGDAGLDDDARYWARVAPGPAWNLLPPRLFRRRGVRGFAARDVPDGLAAAARRRGVTVPILLVAAVARAIAGVAAQGDVRLLLFLEKRERAEARDLFANLASMMPVRLDAGGAVDDLVARTAAQLLASYEHTDHLMRRPTLWNDLWGDAPAPLRRLATRLSARLVARWPEARLDPDALAQYLFAVVPWPRRPRGGGREVAVAVNVLPEVYQPAPAAGGDLRVLRRRTLPQILRPGDLVVGGDAMLARVLHVHVSRGEAGGLVVNLYGGAIDPDGLDEIARAIVSTLDTIAAS